MHRIHLFVTYDGKSPPRLAPQANVKFTCWLRRPGKSIALRDNSIVSLLHYPSPSRKCRRNHNTRGFTIRHRRILSAANTPEMFW